MSRPTTKDLDLLGEKTGDMVKSLRPMPDPLARAIADVARTYALAGEWVNLGPDSLLDFGLPEGFVERLERLDYGGLVTWFAGRFDMICFKLYAAVDLGLRSHHLQDLRELGPSRAELVSAARWTLTHDPSPGFRKVLGDLLDHLGMEVVDGDLD